jgi:hypothetical protein
LLFSANLVSKSLILFTLMVQAMQSSIALGLARATRRHIAQHGILQG